MAAEAERLVTLTTTVMGKPKLTGFGLTEALAVSTVGKCTATGLETTPPRETGAPVLKSVPVERAEKTTLPTEPAL